MSRTSRRIIAAAVAAGFVMMGTAALAGTITGTVTYTGKVPNLKPIAMDADPNCAKKHTTPQPSDVLVMGDGNTMGNILVRVTKGLPAGKTYPAPTTPVVMDQNGCHYEPHVIGIMEGQQLLIKNSDGILHNVHALPRVNKPFNRAMPATVKESNATFEKAEDVFPVKCDVHPWMSAYIAVLTNPFFSVTKRDGKFSIGGLDPGTYTIEAWHEKLGTQTATVTVGASDTKTADFKFAAPAAK
ncbi:MAG TPA: carboxypeptidase regulatory-like domain-containing protein [Patescibacteria group bacterium]|nr:carboxypeptidase regulatory-like domain-containing protein [Patescibacteria group bacterium]